MYKKIKPPKTDLLVNQQFIGETLEQKCYRILNNKEPIKDGAPLIYTERKDGVLPNYNPRTDKWEIAVEGMTKVATNHIEKRNETIGEQAKKGMEKEISGTEPIPPAGG